MALRCTNSHKFYPMTTRSNPPHLIQVSLHFQCTVKLKIDPTPGADLTQISSSKFKMICFTIERLNPIPFPL